jgi:tetratricopeptide (TPR) repeat protein
MTTLLPLLPLLALAVGDGDFWPRMLLRNPEVERWKLEGDQRLQMGKLEQVREAEIAYAEAVRLAPRDARARRDHAEALRRLDRFDDCAAELRVARALDERLEPGMVPVELGICLARGGHYRQAALEYRRAIDAREGVQLALVRWNLGDVEMALGHLEESLHQYELALAAVAQTGREAAPDLNGSVIQLALAVALDRAEEDGRSRALAKRAHEAGVLRRLSDGEDIFFLPPEDRSYSVALALEAGGDTVGAVEHWNEYLAAAPRGPWSGRARQHLATLLVPTAAAGRDAPPPELTRCLAGHPGVVANVRLWGLGRQPGVRIYPYGPSADIVRCLQAAGARLERTGRWDLVGTHPLDSRPPPP